MTMLDVDALRRLPGAMSPEEAGRFTPQASDAPENPYQELDGRLKAEPAKEAAVNPYEDLDTKFNAQKEGPVKRSLKQLVGGAATSPFELAGGLWDMGLAGKQAATGKRQEYGTGTKLGQQYAGPSPVADPTTWYERLARAEGVASPLTLAAGAFGGPLGALGAAGGVAASSLAEPYIEKAAGFLPERWRPAAEIAASALLAHRAGKIPGQVLGPKPNMPTKVDIKNEGSALYNKVDNAGVKVIPGTVNSDIVDKSFADIGVGANINAPRTSAHLEALRQDPLGPSTDIRTLTERYKALGKVKIREGGLEDYRAANIARGNIKSYLDNLPNNMNYVTDGHANVPGMFKDWTDANANWGAFKTIGDIESRWTGAKFKARSTYTGQGANDLNAINQAFRPIVDPNKPNVGRNYTRAQKDMVGNIIYGSLPEKGLRIWSKAAPDSAIGMAATAPGWLGSLATGSPLPLLWNAVQVGGIPARSAAKYIQRKNIRALRDNVIQQSPLFKKMNPTLPAHSAEAEEEAGGIGGALGTMVEKFPEVLHKALDVGLESRGQGEKDKKEADEGGYSMGHRLLKAVGGYDSAFFKSGGYDDPRGENFADPQAFQLMIARQGARPITPVPQTAVGGGPAPMPNYAIGGYNWLWGKDKTRAVPEPVDTGSQGSRYGLFGSFSTVSKPHPPKGGASMQDLQDEDTGGYDDSAMPMSQNIEDRRGLPYHMSLADALIPTMLLNGVRQDAMEYLPSWLTGRPTAYDKDIDQAAEASKHFQPWSPIDPAKRFMGGGYDDPYASNPMSPDFQFGQQTGGLLGAIGAGVNRGIIAPFANSVAGSIPAPYESPAAVAPALWNAIGRARGARRFGGYSMGQVSPLAGGGGF